MKIKFFHFGALLLSLALFLCACSPIIGEVPEHLSVYTSFYPIYALADLVVRDIPDLELHCLVQPQDNCLRSYELSDWDLYLLAYSANAFLQGGCGLESFSDTLRESDLPQAEVLYGLDLYTGTSVSAEGESHFSGENPHLYMSVAGSMKIVENIASAMSVMDARYSEIYDDNLQTAQEQLSALLDEITASTAHLRGQKVIIMNEALIYSATDYGLEMDLIFERESGQGLYDDELEDCLETLSGSSARVVLIESQAPEQLILALESAGYSVAKMDILSTGRELDGYERYFEAQRTNANAVVAAFACIE